jgi:hypothetical protein
VGVSVVLLPPRYSTCLVFCLLSARKRIPVHSVKEKYLCKPLCFHLFLHSGFNCNTVQWCQRFNFGFLLLLLSIPYGSICQLKKKGVHGGFIESPLYQLLMYGFGSLFFLLKRHVVILPTEWLKCI